MKRFLILFISFIVFLTAPLLHAAEAAEPSDHGSTLQEILILNSYHPGYAWSDDEQAGIIDVLRGKDKNWLPVIEYLDLKRLPDGRHLVKLKQLFRSKYQNKKFSVVIAMDNPALEFAMVNRAELFRNAPIVFCGINNYTPSLLKGHPNVTGIAEAIDIAGTIEVMLRLHPAAREIFVTNDYTVTGLAVRKEIEALVPRFGAKVRFRFTDPLTMEELLKELERLPKDSLVLDIAFLTDKSYRTFGVTETTKLFYEHSPVPIYSTYKQRLGFGIVGGKLLSARIHGANAGRIALKVLAGEKASAIPVVLESDSQFMFDYKVMSRFGIPLSALPEGSTVINKPVSFYAAHRVVIQTALGVIGILIMVISLLTVIIIQRRQSTIVLRESEERLRFHTDNSPMAIVEWNTDFVVTRWTGAAEKMFGWSFEETIGKPIMELRMIYEEDIPIVQSVMQQLTDGKSKYVVSSNRNYTKEGQVIHCEWYNSVLHDSAGKMRSVMSQVLDITERKQAEEALKEREEKYWNLFNNAEVGIFRTRLDGSEVMEINRRFLDIVGMTLEETLGKPSVNLWADPKEREEMFKRLVEDGSVSAFEYKMLNKRQGGVRNCLTSLRLYREQGILEGSILDITDRRQAEEALRRAEKNFRRSLDDSPLGVRIVTIEGETIYANRAILDCYGCDSIEELRTTPLKERYTPESYAEFQIRKEKRNRGDYGPSEYEISIVRKDGEVRHLQVFRKEILWDGERQFQVIYQDITERKRAEEALQDSREQMRALAGHLQAVREEERTLIAREIHDELGGALTGLKIDVSLLTRAVLKIENETVRTSLLAGMDSMIKFTDATIQTVRRIAMELRPGVLDDLGLVAALEWQLKDFEKRTGIRCEFFPPAEDISLDADLATALFRIFQEALTNVVRHSGATEVHVHLRADADSSTLELEDNGQGIEKEKTLSSKSLGLLGMRERAQMFGGRITVTGTPGRGTIVTVEIPPAENKKMDRDQEGVAG